MGEEFYSFNPLGFEAKSNFGQKTSKINSYSTNDLKQDLNDKSPIHGRETASIFRFNADNGGERASIFRFSAETF